jgi:hypothetical protein
MFILFKGIGVISDVNKTDQRNGFASDAASPQSLKHRFYELVQACSTVPYALAVATMYAFIYNRRTTNYNGSALGLSGHVLSDAVEIQEGCNAKVGFVLAELFVSGLAALKCMPTSFNKTYEEEA